MKEMNIEKTTIIGGSGVVSDNVKRTLEAENFSVERLAGENRWDTAKIVAEKYFPNAEKAIMTNDGCSGIFADALMGGYLGAKENTPLLLTAVRPLNTLTKNYLADQTRFISVLGGESVIAADTFTEIANPNDEIAQPEIQLPEATGGVEPIQKFDSTILNQEFLKYVNNERIQVGVGPLIYMPELQEGTNVRLNDMISIDAIGHTRPDGTPWYTVFDHLNCAGAMCENVAYTWVEWLPEEEILAGERTRENALAEIFFDMYFNSPSHYKNMIGAEYNSLAVSTVILPKNGKIFNAITIAARK